MTNSMEELDFTCLILINPKPVSSSLSRYWVAGNAIYPGKVMKRWLRGGPSHKLPQTVPTARIPSVCSFSALQAVPEPLFPEPPQTHAFPRMYSLCLFDSLSPTLVSVCSASFPENKNPSTLQSRRRECSGQIEYLLHRGGGSGEGQVLPHQDFLTHLELDWLESPSEETLRLKVCVPTQADCSLTPPGLRVGTSHYGGTHVMWREHPWHPFSCCFRRKSLLWRGHFWSLGGIFQSTVPRKLPDRHTVCLGDPCG